MINTVSQIRDEWFDREAIRDCLYRYARGIDRCDEEILRSAYWPDATDNHLTFSGNIDEFVGWALPKIRSMDQNVHMIGNIFIRLTGDKAAVESYIYGIQRLEAGGVMQDVVAAGRYLDRFERRNDEWRIAHRLLLTDWFRQYPDSADWTAGPFGMGKVPRGSLKPDDHSYSWLGADLSRGPWLALEAPSTWRGRPED